MIGNADQILVVLTAGALLACSPNSNGTVSNDRDARTQIAASRQINSADDATLLVSAAIQSNGLTTLRPECLQYFANSRDPGEFVVEVRENHQRPECKGDPQTAPHLFDVRVDKSTGAMMTNANAAPDAFHPLPPSH